MADPRFQAWGRAPAFRPEALPPPCRRDPPSALSSQCARHRLGLTPLSGLSDLEEAATAQRPTQPPAFAAGPVPRSPQGPRTVVIGAGFGGLAAALRARALGHQVDVFERLDQLGGRARVFRRDGYSFDAGPTVLTAPHLFAELFALFGERLSDHVRLLPVDPWYRITFADGRHFDYGGDEAEMARKVAAFAPGDADGFVRLMARTKELFAIGYEQYGAAAFHSPATMLRVLPHLLRLGGWRSMHALVASHVKDESLRRVFTLQTLLIGGHPWRTPAIYALIQHLERRWGIWFAEGGTAAVVAALADLARRHGVAFHTGRTVERIATEHGRVAGVVLEGGATVPADRVIANADAPAVYADLLPAAQRRRWTDRRLRRLQPSMGLFVLYFGTTRQYPDVAHHTMVLGERYRALLDEVFGTGATLPEDPSLYLHRPTATDPALAPPGHDAFYVLAPVPNLRAPIDWRTAGPAMRDRVVAILSRRGLPDLERHITSESWLAPDDFARDYLSRDGSGFSTAPTLMQSAWFRFHNRCGDVAGLYLVGAGTHPGAGVPGVLTSAKVVETLLREDAATQRDAAREAAA